MDHDLTTKVIKNKDMIKYNGGPIKEAGIEDEMYDSDGLSSQNREYDQNQHLTDEQFVK